MSNEYYLLFYNKKVTNVLKYNFKMLQNLLYFHVLKMNLILAYWPSNFNDIYIYESAKREF